ncbi:MAG: type III-B CRISPR module RAMP protein Cmr6 [Armatimonadia bacterium]
MRNNRGGNRGDGRGRGDRGGHPPQQEVERWVPLPKDAQCAWRNAGRTPNLALLLSRYSRYETSGGKPVREQKSQKQALRSLLDRWNPDVAAAAAKAVLERRRYALRQRARSRGEVAIELTGTTVWRAVSGMGEASVYENAITLDELYGFPIFRGSAAKGMTRHWAEVWDDDAPNKQCVSRVFGEAPQGDRPGYMGKVEFLGGIPIPPKEGQPWVEIDIMNPHYPDWYAEGKPPADWSQPRPIFFLAIPQERKFAFHIVGPPCCIDEAAQWHVAALKNIGIGAKTAAGYGYFCGIEETHLT